MTFITFALIGAALCDLCSAGFLQIKTNNNVVPPITTPDQNTPVYVVISSFQDGIRCARTLGFAIDKAAFRKRVHFRVLQALDEGDESCENVFKLNYLKQFCAVFAAEATESCEEDIKSRTQFWTIPTTMGRGATHQRGLLSEKIQEHRPEADAFCLTIDAHMDFNSNWDMVGITEWNQIGNEFAVITGYPADYGPKVDPHRHVRTCGYVRANDMPRGAAPDGIWDEPGQSPYPTMNWAAGFSFHRCHADLNVPVDKHLEMIFNGEEINRAVRLWTSGYDMYVDIDTIVTHDYTNAKQNFWKHTPSDWNGNWDGPERYANDRIHAVLHNPNVPLTDGERGADLGVYTLGNQRSIEQYVEWSHVNLGPSWDGYVNEKNLTSKVDCANLQRVPVRSAQDLKASVGALPANRQSKV